MSDAMIQCEALGRTYYRGDVEITPLQSVALEINKGEFVALMGPSGSGKTTLLNILAGIDRPTIGRVVIDGVDTTSLSSAKLADWRARTVGYVFQLYNLIPVLSAYENVEVPLLLQRMSRKARHHAVSEALIRVGIADRSDHYPRQLSGGQEQRVAIARAIVSKPTLLVADEPTGDLDSHAAIEIMNLIAELNQELGMTILMVTHDDSIAAHAHRLIHLLDGHVIHGDQASARAMA